MGLNHETERSSSSPISSGYQSSSTDSNSSPKDGADMDGSHLYRCLSVLPGHEGHVFSLALAPDQMLYSGSDCGELRACRWPSTELDMQGGAATASTQFSSGKGSVKAMLVVGNKVFTAHQDQKIRVWKRAGSSKRVTSSVSHKLVATLPTVKDYVMTYISPKSTVQVRRHKKALWIDHHDTISVLAVGRGVLYSGSWDKTIKVWRLSDLKCIESIPAHIDAVNALVVDSSGFLYSGSADGTVKVWERSKTPGLKSTTRHTAVATLTPSKHQSVNALALSADGTVCYAGSSDKCIAVWAMHDEGTATHMRNKGALRGHRLAVLCLASAGDVLVSGSADKTIRVWRRNPEENTHQCLAVLHGHSRPVKCLASAMEPLGAALLVYSGSMDQSVRVWWVSLDGDVPSSPDVAPFLTPNASPLPEFSQSGSEPGFGSRLQ